MSRIVLALLASAAVSMPTLSACGSSFGPGTGGCRVTADNPHRSKNMPSDVVGKGKIVCDVPAADVFLYVQVEREDGNQWVSVADGDQPLIGVVEVGRSAVRQAAHPCEPGRFRTAARGEGTLGGQRSASVAWTYSQVVTDPCGT